MTKTHAISKEMLRQGSQTYMYVVNKSMILMSIVVENYALELSLVTYFLCTISIAMSKNERLFCYAHKEALITNPPNAIKDNAKYSNTWV